ncbi:MAG: esterase-like activity of phytase family protein [Amaricoccus sp.]
MRRALLVIVFLLAAAARADGPRLVLDSTYTWREPWKGFGGFSGLVVEDGGTDFLTISDRGNWARGSMDRTVDGQLTAVHLTDHGPILDQRGRTLRGQSFDAEGLARDANGRIYISFEGQDRIRRYADLRRAAGPVPSHPDFRFLPVNLGLESLAVAADGTLYAIPESTPAPEDPFPVYRFRDGAWDKSFRIPHRGDFNISDAAVGPDGKLYVLEREFSWLGFRSRVRRFDVGPDGLDNETTLLASRLNQLDNMEGISVWTDPQGRIRVTLISDDNFFALQRTMFADYILDES